MAVINGNNGNNTLNGTAQADTIDGLGGNDIINGLAGNDILRGGANVDTIDGGTGNDTITGGTHDDTLNGGTGNDTFVYATGDGLDLFTGGDGTDRIVAAAAGTTIALRSGFAANRSIEAIDGLGNSTIRATSSADTYNFSATTLTGIASIDLGAGNDQLVGSSSADRVRGGTGNDTISGGGGADILEGEDGTDTLDGGAGVDRLIGGADADTFAITTLSGGADRIADFGNGADTLRLGVLPASGVTASNLSSFVRAQRVDGNVVIRVDTNGSTGGSAFVDAAVLEGFNGATVRVQIGSQFFNVAVPANRNPTLDDDTISVAEDATTGNLLTHLQTGDTDPDGDPLRVTGVTQGSKGSVFFDAGTAARGDETITYTADGAVLDALAAGATTTDTFTYIVLDDNGGRDIAKVTVTITGVNDAPRLTPAVDVHGVADGYVLMQTSPILSAAYALTQQPDGKLVAVGRGFDDSLGDVFAVVRYYADGSLDATFGGDGFVVTNVGGPGDEAIDVIAEPNGKLVVLGGPSDFTLLRYNADGTLDRTFGGGDGIATGFPTVTSAISAGVVRQSDGKLIVAATAFGEGNVNFALARYTANGTLDTTFGGGDGLVTTDFGGADFVGAVIRQPDGRLVLAGQSGARDLAIARYNADGTLDTTFDGDGLVSTIIRPTAYSEGATALVRQSDGKLLVTGSTDMGLDSEAGRDLFLVRYNVDGTLDSSFGDDGIVTDHIGSEGALIAPGSIIQQADGKVAVAGTFVTRDFLRKIVVARYNADGTSDASFGGGDGVVIYTFPPDSSGTDVTEGFDIVEQPGGKLVVAGRRADSLALVRFNSDGSLDTTFGEAGMRDQGMEEQQLSSIVIPANLFTDPDGDPLTLTATQADGSPLPSWLTFDPATRTFSGTAPERSPNVQIRLVATDPGGLCVEDEFEIVSNVAPRAQGVRTNFGSDMTVEDSRMVIVQPDGTIVVAGSRLAEPGNPVRSDDFALVRYLADGTLDTSFGNGGLAQTNFGPVLTAERPWLIARQADGKLVVVGREEDHKQAFELPDNLKIARYNADGSLDLTFGGGDGVVTTPLPAESVVWPSANVLLSDGKFAVAGFFDGSPMVARFNADGTVDTTFGGGTGFANAPGSHAFATAVIEQPGGKLLSVGGYFPSENLTLVMFNGDGSLDSTFGGGDGIITTDLQSADAPDPSFHEVVQQSDGTILLAGRPNGWNIDTDVVIARLNADGTRDPTFGDDGLVVTNIGPGVVEDVIQQSDGKLVALASAFGRGRVGYDYDANGIVLMRYNADGTLDTTFGGDGMVLVTSTAPATMLPGGDLSIAQQPDGKLVVSGAIFMESDDIDVPFADLAVMRFNTDGTIDESFRGFSSRTVAEDASFSIEIPDGLFVDPEGEALTYSLTLANGDPLPAWISIDATTGTISGTAPDGASDVLLRITATDPHDLSDSHDFTLDVTESTLAGAISSDESATSSIDMVDVVATVHGFPRPRDAVRRGPLHRPLRRQRHHATRRVGCKPRS
jgi:uncharacterized delta-60 repeat protein